MDLPAGLGGRVAVVVDRYPCVSESFVRRELAALEAQGFELAIVVCSPAAKCDPWFPSGLRAAVIRTDACARSCDGWQRVRAGAVALRNLQRAIPLFPAGARGVKAAARAAWTAAAIQPVLERWSPDWVHAHFLGMPAATASLLTRHLRIPLSISAHARDIFVPSVRLAPVCARARFVAVCSEHAQATLMGRLPASLAQRVVHFPHQLNCARTIADRPARNGEQLRLLSVCRLVPKKGIDVVLRALALLPDAPYRYRIVGDGPERARLQALVEVLGLDGVEFAGPAPPEEVPMELARADVFVLGTSTAQDGDRDGIPNAMLEAMAAGVPVVMTDSGAVSEVIRHGRTGWLAPPNCPAALAKVLMEAASDYVNRRHVAVQAHLEVQRRFSDENRCPLATRLTIEIDSKARYRVDSD